MLIFSLEMSNQKLASRLLSQDARVDATKMRTGQLNAADWVRIPLSTGRIGDVPIWIDDKSG